MCWLAWKGNAGRSANLANDIAGHVGIGRVPHDRAQRMLAAIDGRPPDRGSYEVALGSPDLLVASYAPG